MPVESEARFVWRQLGFAASLPVRLLLVLFGRRPASELARPFAELGGFLWEAPATLALLLANMAVFALEVFLWTDADISPWIFEPAQLWHLELGPMAASWFLHASLLHLGGNMLALFIFGRVVEGAVGAGRFVLIYAGSALVSSVTSALFSEGGIGASGAIAGVIAAGLLLRPLAWTFLVIGIPLPLMVVGWLAIAAEVFWLLHPRADHIAHFAHIGGFVSILVLMFVLSRRQRDELRRGFWINAACLTLASGLLWWLRR